MGVLMKKISKISAFTVLPKKLRARRYYIPKSVPARFWRPKTQQPVVVLAQLNAEYAGLPGLIRPLDKNGYLDRLRGVIGFASMQQADFCVLPEFSWPLVAAGELRELLPESGSCVYIVPFEHMSVPEYRALLDELEVEEKYRDEEEMEIAALNPNGERQGVVNAALVFIPKAAGYHVVPQRKLRPAELEEKLPDNREFVKGRTVRVIKAKGCSFAVMICFDFIHRDPGVVARPLDALAGSSLDLLFIPECNPSPTHGFYLMASIDLHQAPGWSKSGGAVIFNNVAAGSVLPGYDAHFGFSRMSGRFGKVNESPEFLDIQGFVSCFEPKSLGDLKARGTVVHANARTIVFRPEQSVFVCHLPPLGEGAVADRQAASINTKVAVYRPLGAVEDWLPVRPRPSEQATGYGFASRRRPSKVEPIEERQQRFLELIRNQTLLVVYGERGSGKTTLVSKMAEEMAIKPDDREVWIDLSDLEKSEEALVEEVLLRIGRASDLTKLLDEQYEALQSALRRQPTILVLDGADAWKREHLDRLLKMHGWKTLVVVSARTVLPDQPCVLEMKLESSDFGRIVKAMGGMIDGEIPASLALTMFVASNGSALVAAWTGEFIARNPRQAQILNRDLANDYGIYHGVARQMDMANVDDPALAERIAPKFTLKLIYDRLRRDLNQPAIAVLHVLCSMPAPLGLADLSGIIGKPISAKVIESLDELSFVQRGDGLYSSHPFVRQVWDSSGQRRTLTPGLIAWAESVLTKYSRDHDPDVSQAVVLHWANVSAVLGDLAASGSVGPRKAFLRLWRMADGFLWAVGRWRERQKLGEAAWEIALSLKDYDTAVLAIYDALAMTHWYRDRTVDEAERLIDKAAALAKKHKLAVAQARIEWYRSRMLLYDGRVKEALGAAEDAVELAKASKDPETHTLALIGLGDAVREDGLPELALRRYGEAEDLLKHLPALRAREIKAVLARSYGRVFLRSGDYAHAIRRFEDAIDGFIKLGLVVQAARTAVYNAEALARAGEPETAQRHLDWGRLRLDPLGSVLRQQSIKEAEQAIKQVMR
jgi:tetratricopeptide (TPR) repeat protein